MLVAGVDGIKGGWVAVVLAAGRFETSGVWGSLAGLARDLEQAEVVAVDIPIGLPDRDPREADLAARAFVGPRRSSVFPAPPRAVLEAGSYEEAGHTSRALSGRGISQQSWALRAKILETDEVARTEARLHEAHPEVTFRAMAGAPLPSPKRTWDGQMQRRALLDREGITLPSELGPAGGVPVDDVLDAAACAWTAHRIARGEARTLPDDPDPSLPRIWF